MLAMQAGASAQVELRRGGGTIGSGVLEVSEAGVLIQEEGRRQLVGWERVRRVIGERAADAEAFAPIADKAWRCQERLRRGDIGGAEPLLEELYQEYRGKRGPTAAAVAEGLARCRTARGGVTAAVTPWFHAMAAKGEVGGTAPGEAPAVWIGGTIEPGGFIDAAYGLCPELPPVWLRGAALDSLIAADAWESLKSEPGAVGHLAALYELGARLSAAADGAASDEAMESLRALPAMSEAGSALVRDMLLARFGDEQEREQARGALRARIDGAVARPRSSTERRVTTPRWVEAWCRFALGHSLLRESDEQTGLLGVIELLHLPSRFGGEQAYLAGLALADGAAKLAQLGDDAGAGVLKHELLSKYPRHPAVNLDEVRKIKAIAPRSDEADETPTE